MSSSLFTEPSSTFQATHSFQNRVRSRMPIVLPLVGFMLAYPYCHRCPRARRYIRLALEIFDSAGSNSAATVRAAALTGHLSAKVDTLLRILNIDDSLVPMRNSQGGGRSTTIAAEP
ncbi:hypothetical protein BO94DRAFT_530781 [Aspergillus sclerotioniger CBS 115572]|uniref:Uncharacterized protein n=1 Tax=Aspergillus sclerotioniger CBS 115572 TaxID=1450535 RepID=A0A317XGN0_9EURO|nr:hypothetical protein BO94DRAFT_530781 [Aspergillus sclerotioniger CBS 115572]PWY96100.1 hypothetical protein BO94DRAFT_530781 [Aspergillus sclerotioniger CBS 115572]